MTGNESAHNLWAMVNTVYSDLQPEAFRSWRLRHSLTQEQAAQALGISTRSVSYYEKDKPVPETIRLAMIGYDCETLSFDPRVMKALKNYFRAVD